MEKFQRVEKKYLLPVSQLAPLLAGLQAHMEPDRFCRNVFADLSETNLSDPDLSETDLSETDLSETDRACKTLFAAAAYPVASHYLDAPDGSVLRASVQKPPFKQKLRVRSYGLPTSKDARVFLETKRKCAGVVYKRRTGVTLDMANDFLQHPAMPWCKAHPAAFDDVGQDRASRQVLCELAEELQICPQRPEILVTYDRIALFGREDAGLRLTVDGNLQAFESHELFVPGNTKLPTLQPGFLVMEVKVPGAFPLWMAHLLSTLGLYGGSFSKVGSAYLGRLGHPVIPTAQAAHKMPLPPQHQVFPHSSGVLDPGFSGVTTTA